jgi:hypothetical protein
MVHNDSKTMEIIQLCPKCGLPALAVNIEAVKYNVVERFNPG